MINTKHPTLHPAALVDAFAPLTSALSDLAAQAVNGVFVPAVRLLTVFGDGSANTIDLSRDAAGKILLNGGASKILGGTPTVANTTSMTVFGLDGNDVITLNEAHGALGKASLFGGAGNDVLTGGSAADQLFGESGNDILLGKGGNDLLFGGAGNDVLTGGDGDDQMFGEAGNDRMVWNPGDDSDLMEGGADDDTAEVNGGNGAETFAITANGARVRFDRVTPAPFSIDIGTTEHLVLNANGGDDVISASNGLSALMQLTLDGGAGNDTIRGGDGNDTLIGGDGNDFVDGNRGNDTAFLGSGDDTFAWDPGDGSDTVEGQDGNDTLLFNGANIAEKIDISANGGRVRFTRDVASITMDLNGTEHVAFNALGGADQITVNNLSGTDATQIDVNLAGTPGGNTGDSAADNVIVNGTAGSDVMQVVGDASGIQVLGLTAALSVTHVEGTLDTITLQGGAGDDVIEASAVAAGAAKLVLDGGEGDDVIIGSAGDDVLIGGAGDDVLIGGGGNDILMAAPGNDIVIQGFTAGAGLGDTLDLEGRGLTFDWLMAHTSDIDGNAVIDLGGGQHVTFDGLSSAALNQDDFLLS